jgi:hypothetical protein
MLPRKQRKCTKEHSHYFGSSNSAVSQFGGSRAAVGNPSAEFFRPSVSPLMPTTPKKTMTTSTPSPTQRRLTPFFTRSIHARSRRVNDSSHAAFQETLDTPIHYIRPTISAKKKNCDGGIPLNIYVQMETMPSLEQSVCSGLEEDMQQMEMTLSPNSSTTDSMPGCCSDEEEDALSHALPMAVIDI